MVIRAVEADAVVIIHAKEEMIQIQIKEMISQETSSGGGDTGARPKVVQEYSVNNI